MPDETTYRPTLTIDELVALATEIEPLTGLDQTNDPTTAPRLEAICARYGLSFSDASTQEPLCR